MEARNKKEKWKEGKEEKREGGGSHTAVGKIRNSRHSNLALIASNNSEDWAIKFYN